MKLRDMFGARLIGPFLVAWFGAAAGDCGGSACISAVGCDTPPLNQSRWNLVQQQIDGQLATNLHLASEV